MMAGKIAVGVVTGLGLLMSSGAWGWYDDGKRIVIESHEYYFCSQAAYDAGFIMQSRQTGKPLVYDDFYEPGPPSELREEMRKATAVAAATYPIVKDPDLQTLLTDDFLKIIKSKCLKYYVDHIAPTRPKP